jgi:membrane protease YdiL (CAAX protease family)
MDRLETETQSAHHPASPAVALTQLVATWSLLLAGGAARPFVGREAALLTSFAAAAALGVAARPRSTRRGTPLHAVALGLAAGFLGYPAWFATIAQAGLWLGLAPGSHAAGPWAGGPAWWLASVALGPVFEELLYRERLLEVLRSRTAAPTAVLVTSALFAVPHLEAWSVLGTFLVGIALGTAYHATTSVALCIALHAGLNLAALACGVPPRGPALAPLTSAALGAAVLAFATVGAGSERGPTAAVRGRAVGRG